MVAIVTDCLQINVHCYYANRMLYSAVQPTLYLHTRWVAIVTDCLQINGHCYYANRMLYSAVQPAL